MISAHSWNKRLSPHLISVAALPCKVTLCENLHYSAYSLVIRKVSLWYVISFG